VYDEMPVLRFFYLRDDIPLLLLKSSFIIFIVLLTAIIPSLIENTMYLENGKGLFQDYAFFVLLLTIFLLLVGCKFFFDTIPFTFLGSDSKLKKGFGITGVIDFSKDHSYEQEYTQYIGKQLDFVEGKGHKGKIGLWASFSFLLLIVISINIIPILNQGTSRSYWHPVYIYGFIGSIIRGTILYLILGPHFLWRVIATIIICNNVMKKLTKDKKLKIIPISPDKAGGLRSLGDLALELIYLSLTPIPFALAVIVFVGLPLELIIILIIYFSIVFMTFFLPLSSAHYAMKESRDSDIVIISNSFNNTYQQLMSNLMTKKRYSKEELEISSKLEENYKLYEKASEMPIWPFNNEILIKFGTLVGVPILLIIIQHYIY
jgi:hypothetical protein